MSRVVSLLFVLGLLPPALAADRVERVRARRAVEVKALLEQAGLRGPVEEVALRVFKEERQVELWATDRRGAPMVLVRSYAICAASGDPGPKRKEGDWQVPEGLYVVSRFNPASSYHLALQLDYPNASDRLRSDREHPGGLIFMHGKCASIGCIAIEDGPIEEVYLIAAAARRSPIRIDVFPARMTAAWLEAAAKPALAFWRTSHLSFWQELAPAFQRFEVTRRPAAFRVDPRTGAYVVLP